MAVAGYGQIAALHTQRLAGDGHRLEWLIGRVPERTAAFAREYGYARHTTALHEALADPRLDAVVLGTPNGVHAAQAAACLEAGKHVLVEIPLAMSYAEGRRLAEMARRTGLTLMVAHTHRFHGAMRWVRERVVSGELSFENIVARYLLLRRENVGSSGYVRSWTDSLLWHHGQHAADMVLWLLGVDEPDRVQVAAMVAEPDPKLGVPLDLSILLRTRRDQLGTVAMSYNSDLGATYDFALMGRGETLFIENRVLRNRDGVLYEPGNQDSGLLQDREFIAAIREGRPSAVDADAVLPAMELLQRVEDSTGVQTGRGGQTP
ncbi:Gfo/Idh/MocA family oxidoreductase [Streptomyces sp. NPDC094034]|uniref:Gfo/Idh/MocA family protein n=1 Tax=Streptomyces sp. NPDC094034 TaxID=3155309 RepID=UPI003328532C